MTTTDVLLQVLRGHADHTRSVVEHWDAAQWGALRKLATAQRVGALVAHHLTQAGLLTAAPAELADAWRADARDTTLRNLRLRAAVTRLGHDAHRHGLSLTLLKGLDVAWRAYPSAGLRRMSDIDVLVAADDAVPLQRLASTHGFAAPEHDRVSKVLALQHHLPTMRQGDLLLEIHWRLFAPTEHVREDTDGCLDRSVPASFGPGLRVLALEDLLLHTCLHATVTHQFETGVRSLCDVLMLTRLPDGPDWSRVAARAREWQVSRDVALVLRLSKDLLGASVPDDVLTSLSAPIPQPVIDAARTALFVRHDPNVPDPMARAARAVLGTAPIATRIGRTWRRAWLPSRDLASHPVARTLRPIDLIRLRVDRLSHLARTYLPSVLGHRYTAHELTHHDHLTRWLRPESGAEPQP